MSAKTPRFIDMTIPSGASQSPAINIGAYVVVGLIIPAVWTAANVTFLAQHGQAGSEGHAGTLMPVFDDTGAEVVATVGGASRYVSMKSTDVMSGVQWFSLRSGTNALPVNQAQNTTITVILREE